MRKLVSTEELGLDTKVPIRVGFLGPSILFGGGERWMLDLVRFCDRGRIQWTNCVIAHRWCAPGMRDTLAHFLPVYHEGKIYSNGRVRSCMIEVALQDLFRSSDIVVCWELDFRMRTWTEASRSRIVNVALREDPSLEASVGHGQYLAAVWENCRRSFGRSREGGVRVIPGGVDIARCSPLHPRKVMRQLWACGEEDLVVGYFGRIAPEKNCPALARTIRGLGERGIGVLYGSRASQAEDILASIRSIAGDRVRIFEPTEDIGSVLHAVDVVLLPSRTEGLSYSLLEAWAAGVPVVASPVGALPDLERRFGQLAVTVEPDEPEQILAEAVLDSVTGTQRDEIRQRAQNLVLTNFTVARMAGDWTEYLEGIVRKDGYPEESFYE